MANRIGEMQTDDQMSGEISTILASSTCVWFCKEHRNGRVESQCAETHLSGSSSGFYIGANETL